MEDDYLSSARASRVRVRTLVALLEDTRDLLSQLSTLDGGIQVAVAAQIEAIDIVLTDGKIPA